MLQIILLILKIIGTGLLILFGLLLLLLVAVLFVPIRYRLKVEHGDQFHINGTVSWFLHTIHARVTEQGAKPHIRVHIFGFIIYDNLRQRTSKTEQSKKRNIKKSKNRRIIKQKKTEKSLKVKNNVKEVVIPETIKTVGTGETISKSDIPYIESEDEVPDKIYPTLFQKICNKLSGLKDKIIEFFRGIKDKIMIWIEAAVNIKQKTSLILDFIKNEINQEGFKLTYRSLIKLLKHMLPTKLKSRIIFGTGDPCTTGQALGLVGILYSFYGDKIQIIPDFENMRFEGKHDARGRIRLITILIIVIKFILDKRFKQLKSNMKILKEAL